MTQQQKNNLKTLIDTFMSDLAHHASQSGKAKKLRDVAVNLARDGGEAKLRGENDTWLHEWAEQFYGDAKKINYDTDKSNRMIMADRLHNAIIDLMHEENKE